MTFGMTFATRLFYNTTAVAVLLLIGWMSVLHQSDTYAPRPVAEGSYEYVTGKHECAPTVEGQFPTAAIVYKVGGGYSYTTDPVKIGKGLDEQFAGKVWHGFTAVDFCK